MLGLCGFVAGLIMGWLDDGGFAPLENAMLVAAITFAAALVCLAWDDARRKSAWKRVRRRLSDRPDVTDEEFCHKLPECDACLLLECRNAMATFFEIRPEKIHPTDDLVEDYRHDVFESGLGFIPFESVLKSRNIDYYLLEFSIPPCTSYRDAVRVIESILSAQETELGRDDENYT